MNVFTEFYPISQIALGFYSFHWVFYLGKKSSSQIVPSEAVFFFRGFFLFNEFFSVVTNWTRCSCYYVRNFLKFASLASTGSTLGSTAFVWVLVALAGFER